MASSRRPSPPRRKTSRKARAPRRPGGPAGRARPDPAALTAGELARILQLPRAEITGYIARGLPTVAGGRVNIVHCAAWLCRELLTNGE